MCFPCGSKPKITPAPTHHRHVSFVRTEEVSQKVSQVHESLKSQVSVSVPKAESFKATIEVPIKEEQLKIKAQHQTIMELKKAAKDEKKDPDFIE